MRDLFAGIFLAAIFAGACLFGIWFGKAIVALSCYHLGEADLGPTVNVTITCKIKEIRP